MQAYITRNHTSQDRTSASKSGFRRSALLISLALISILSSTILPQRASAEATAPRCVGELFSDVCPEDWYAPYVTELAAANAIGGYADGTFRPDGQVTRGQLVKLIVAASGATAAVPERATFADVPQTSPFFSSIEIAIANGMVGGYPCGGSAEPCDTTRRPYFRPNASANRGQVAKIISGALHLDSLGPETQLFSDVQPNNPYFGYMSQVAESNAVNGYVCGGENEPCDDQSRSYYRPFSSTTRAQAAKIVNLAVSAAKKRGRATLTPTAIAVATLIATSTATPIPTQAATYTALSTSTGTSSSTATSTFTSVPTFTSTQMPTATSTPSNRHLYGLVGQGGLGEPIDTALIQSQYAAGVRVRLLHLGWDVLQPDGPSSWDTNVVRAFQQRIDALVASGPDVQLYLDLGIQFSPAWIGQIDPLVDQYGNVWQAQFPDGGVNVYWSPTVRQHVANYIQRAFTSLNFRGRLWAVRVGPYRGELLYPEQANSGRNLSFWAFDSHAQAQSPVPGWMPGQPSPRGEAQKFYNWYVDNLVNTFNFQLTEIRKYFSGYVAPVTPGAGMHGGSVGQLISRNLYDTSLSYYGTGNYWQRIFATLPGANQNVINWCSSMGDGSGNDYSSNWWEWSSAKIQAYLAHQNGRQIYGENSGRNPYDTRFGADPRTTMQWIFASMQSNSYLGLMWVNQTDMANPLYASLDQYRTTVAQYP